jgi:hypothetical protein
MVASHRAMSLACFDRAPLKRNGTIQTVDVKAMQ